MIASLEALAAERAASLMTASEMAELEPHHGRMRGFFEIGERDAYFALNSQIHDCILTFARNKALIVAHGRLQGRAARARYFAIVDPARWRQAMQEHEDLMQAMRARDAPAAHVLWRRHLIHTGAAIATTPSGPGVFRPGWSAASLAPPT